LTLTTIKETFFHFNRLYQVTSFLTELQWGIGEFATVLKGVEEIVRRENDMELERYCAEREEIRR